MQREGESGRKKIMTYTRYLTVAILLFQAPSYLINLKMQAGAALASGISWSVFVFPATIILAAGSMFTQPEDEHTASSQDNRGCWQYVHPLAG